MLLVVGLGNPGAEHAKNRHNIGFMAVDAIVRRHGFGPFRAKFHGEIAQGDVAGVRVLALKPTTYMNDSGLSVAAAAAFFKIPPADMVVLHDELDLAGGRLRVKRGGGHAGHNGLRSIHAHLGADYRRIRLGIGHPGDKDRVTAHVLKNFAKADEAWLEKLLDAVADGFPLLVEGNDPGFMSKVALAMEPPKPKAPEPAADGTPERTPDGTDGL